MVDTVFKSTDKFGFWKPSFCWKDSIPVESAKIRCVIASGYRYVKLREISPPLNDQAPQTYHSLIFSLTYNIYLLALGMNTENP